jgi:hypothetical protein
VLCRLPHREHKSGVGSFAPDSAHVTALQTQLQGEKARDDALDRYARGAPGGLQGGTPNREQHRLRSRPERCSAGTHAAFEHEYAALQSMLADADHRSVRRSRQGPLRTPAPGAAEKQQDAQSMEALLHHAIQLRDAIAGLIQVVPEDGGKPTPGSRRTAEQQGSYRSGDAVELAALRAVKAATPASVSALPALRSPSQVPALQDPVQASTVEQENNSKQSNTGAAHSDQPQGKSPGLAVPSSCQGTAIAEASPVRPTAAACDALCTLHMASLTEVQIPYEAVASLEAGGEPALWFTWKMPGAAQRRPWCCLGALGDHEIRRLPAGTFCISHLHADCSAEVQPLQLAHVVPFS